MRGFFKKRGTAETPATATDRLVGVERAVAAGQAQRTQLVADKAQRLASIDRIDSERRALALPAKAEGDVGAQGRLDALNAERRTAEDAVRDIGDGIAELDARLTALGEERSAATRARDEDCIGLLVAEQATLGKEADGDFEKLVAKLRRWAELDLIITSHVARLGGSTGRSLMPRLEDALAGHVYRILPDLARAHAVHLHIDYTQAHRGATFEAMSAIHGPAGMLARASETRETKR
jgi:hypothetical protein